VRARLGELVPFEIVRFFGPSWRNPRGGRPSTRQKKHGVAGWVASGRQAPTVSFSVNNVTGGLRSMTGLYL
jgi:ribosomal protein L32E